MKYMLRIGKKKYCFPVFGKFHQICMMAGGLFLGLAIWAIGCAIFALEAIL